MGHGQPDTAIMDAVEDVLESIKATGFGPTQLVTRDAIYGMNDTATNARVARGAARGQRSGTYISPGVWYGRTIQGPHTVDCGGDTGCIVGKDKGCYLINDIVLKDKDGNWIRSLGSSIKKGNQYVKDATHPHLACYIKFIIAEHVDKYNYTLLKADL